MFSNFQCLSALVALAAPLALGLDTLSPDGTRCIAGFSNDNAQYWTGPDGGLVNFHSNTGWVTDPDGNIISEQDLQFNAWHTWTSSLPYTVDMYCGQDTSQTLTECTSVEVRYAGQDVMSNDSDDPCACGKSATVFEATGYCACYFDC